MSADEPAYSCADMGHIYLAGKQGCQVCGDAGTLMCQVCEVNPALGVAASPLGAVSLAYCRTCLEVHADADFMVEHTLATCGSWEHVAEWFKTDVRVWRKCERCGGTGQDPGGSYACRDCEEARGRYLLALHAYSESDVRRLAREQDEAMLEAEGE